MTVARSAVKRRQAWPGSPTSPLELAGGDSGSDTSSVSGDNWSEAKTHLKHVPPSSDSTGSVGWSQPPAIGGHRKAPTVRCRAVRQPPGGQRLSSAAAADTKTTDHVTGPLPKPAPAKPAAWGGLSPFPGMSALRCSSDIIMPPPPPPPRQSQPGSQVPLAAALLALAPAQKAPFTSGSSADLLPDLPVDLSSPSAATSSKWQSAGPLFSWDPASTALGRNIWSNSPGQMPYAQWGNEDACCSLPPRRGSY